MQKKNFKKKTTGKHLEKGLNSSVRVLLYSEVWHNKTLIARKVRAYAILTELGALLSKLPLETNC